MKKNEITQSLKNTTQKSVKIRITIKVTSVIGVTMATALSKLDFPKQ